MAPLEKNQAQIPNKVIMKIQRKVTVIIKGQYPFADFQLIHRVMRKEQSAKRRKSLKKGNPPTTQASGAAARSSRPRGASRAQGTGATKIR